MTILTRIESPSGAVDVYIDDDGRMVLRPKRGPRLSLPQS